MDLPEFDVSVIGADKLGVIDERWAKYIEMMADVGYIKGVSISKDITGSMNVDAENMRITLKGLEYLQENSIMQKMYKAAKGFTDVINAVKP
jgi:hypothetical protein